MDKKKKEKGKERSPRRKGVSAYAFSRFPLVFKKKIEKERVCMCAHVCTCLKERE